jgi:ribosomal protein S18 acetylase RimI-like enzyme
MNLTLREATVNDATLIADISRQSFYDTFAQDNREKDMSLFLDRQFTRGKLILEVGKKEHEFYLVQQEDKVAGYLKLRFGVPPASLAVKNALEVARLYCMKDFIGKGVGKMLMQKSIERAAAKGMQAVWLGVWEKNQRAIDFYTAFGFEKFDETDFLLGHDLQRDWLMKKML